MTIIEKIKKFFKKEETKVTPWYEKYPNVVYRGVFKWEDYETLDELINEQTIIRKIVIYEG